jgi:hypothetical protein
VVRRPGVIGLLKAQLPGRLEGRRHELAASA